jgi:hypothetical protein
VTVGKISDVTREYALFEFLEEGHPLLDVGDSDEGKFEESHAQSDENRVIDHVAYEVSTCRGLIMKSRQIFEIIPTLKARPSFSAGSDGFIDQAFQRPNGRC